jgi:hypothetical protein
LEDRKLGFYLVLVVRPICHQEEPGCGISLMNITTMQDLAISPKAPGIWFCQQENICQNDWSILSLLLDYSEITSLLREVSMGFEKDVFIVLHMLWNYRPKLEVITFLSTAIRLLS